MPANPLPWLAVLGLLAAPAAPAPPSPPVPPPEPESRGAAAEDRWNQPPLELDVPYATTPMQVVEAMLRAAGTGPDDVVFDLGCGDGRIVISAVEGFGARLGVCVELDPVRIGQARDNAREAGVEERILFIEGDLFEVDLGQATVVTLYLLPDVNEALRPKLLRELAPGSRVVSHAFRMGDWEPEEEIRVGGRKVYLWTVPE